MRKGPVRKKRTGPGFLQKLPEFFADGEQILKGFRALGDIPQQGRGVIDGGHPNAVFFYLLTMLPGDAVLFPNQPHGGNSP